MSEGRSRYRARNASRVILTEDPGVAQELSLNGYRVTAETAGAVE